MSNATAFVVRERSKAGTSGRVETVSLEPISPGDVAIDVSFSSLNYKDALAAQGHPGVARNLPHVPGIDCAGVIVESNSPDYRAGDDVLITGYGLGADAWGGWSSRVHVPGDWIVPMPTGLDARTAMLLGTAGFTAAQCVSAVVDRGITPDRGPVLVTGATGGVGVWSVRLLAKLGFHVVAVTGKSERESALRQLGASEVVGRDVLIDSDPSKPLLPAKWAAAVDTVGGEPLADIVRSTHHRAVVSCCGLVAGTELPLTMYPFLLRGVTLAGIDSAKCPRDARLQIWERLSGPWLCDLPDEWVTKVTLDEIPGQVDKILAGQVAGRTIVEPKSAAV